MGIALASAAGVGVELGGPRRCVATVVGEGGQGLAGPSVGGPAEVDGPAFAGLLRHRGSADLGAGVFHVNGPGRIGPTSAVI